MRWRLPLTLSLIFSTLSGRVMAQVQLGPLSSNLSGSVTGGYTEENGSGGSSHGFGAGGIATLNGNYYDPGFLTYTIQPFYNQSWANSDFQSITDSSGISAGSSVFSGSNYPGSVSYSRIWNGSGNYGVPGLSNFTTHGDSDTLGVSWGEHVPHWPVLSLTYTQGGGDYSLYGSNGQSTNDFHAAGATLSYALAGFTFTAGFQLFENQSELPALFGETAEDVRDRTRTYNFGIGHRLPFHGSFGGAVSRSNLNSDSTGGTYNGVVDTVSAGASFAPVDRLTLSTQGIYNDNLLGSLIAPEVSSGAVTTGSATQESSHSLDIFAIESYQVPAWHLTFITEEEYRQQEIFGYGYRSNLYTGTVVYSKALLGGYLTLSGSGTYTILNPGGYGSTGFIGSASYLRRVRQWRFSVAGNYNQNAETALVTYTTDSYGYSAMLGRKFDNHKYWSVNAAGSKSGVVQNSNFSTFSQSYGSSFGWKWATATGTFTRSSGNGLLTATGITSVSPVVSAITPTGLLFFGGTSITGSIGANPIRGMILSGSYSHSLSNTNADSVISKNLSEIYMAQFSYLLRKVTLQGGYLRLYQGFTGTGNTPVAVNNLYIGLQRWFNFF